MTLCVSVLAQNGFVFAADSRRTKKSRNTREYNDGVQKIFHLTDKTALLTSGSAKFGDRYKKEIIKDLKAESSIENLDIKGIKNKLVSHFVQNIIPEDIDAKFVILHQEGSGSFDYKKLSFQLGKAKATRKKENPIFIGAEYLAIALMKAVSKRKGIDYFLEEAKTTKEKLSSTAIGKIDENMEKLKSFGKPRFNQFSEEEALDFCELIIDTVSCVSSGVGGKIQSAEITDKFRWINKPQELKN